MPAQNGVGRDDRRQLRQKPATKTGAEDRQAPPFAVGQPHSLTSQLRFQDAVLFAQVQDDRMLFVVDSPHPGHSTV
jgi:hypothetical protein